MKFTRGIRSIAPAVAILLLAACSAAPAAPAETPLSERPQPSASGSASPVAVRPEPRMSLDCEQILPASEATAMIAPSVVEQPAITSVYSTSPLTSAVFNLGALFCEWGNAPKAQWWISQSDYQGARLQIVPVSAEQWEAYGPEPGFEDPEYPGVMISIPDENLWSWCWAPDGDPPRSSCYAEGIVNGYWIFLESYGLGNNAQLSTQELHALVRPMLDRVVSGLNQQSVPALWPGVTAERPMPTECVDYLSVEQGEQLTGIDISAIGAMWDGPRRGLVWMAMHDQLAVACDLMLVESEGTAARIAAMDQGSWRVHELNGARIADGSAVPVELAGLGATETSALQCADEFDACSIDMSYKGHWLQVSVDPNRLSGGAPDHSTARANITLIAEAVLANLEAAG